MYIKVFRGLMEHGVVDSGHWGSGSKHSTVWHIGFDKKSGNWRFSWYYTRNWSLHRNWYYFKSM